VRYLLQRENLELGRQAEEQLLTRIKEAGQNKERVTEDKVLAWAREAAATPADGTPRR
jgi:hypothetical protein